jgi:mxaD protein
MKRAFRRFFRLAILSTAFTVGATLYASANGALTAAREATIDSPPATVWKLIGQYNALDVWHPAVTGSTMTGDGMKEGTIRTLTLADGATITEPLVSYSGEKYSYSYAITKSPLPIKNYVATISLSPAADGKTLMKWGAQFDAAGAADNDAIATMNGIYEAGLSKVVSIFKKK